MFIGNKAELYVTVGEALWHIETLEYALAHYITLIELSPGDQEKAFNLLEKSFRKTLGQLVQTLKKSVVIDPRLEDRLAEFPEKRNWLAHRMFRCSHSDIFDPQRFIQLLKRVSKISEDALSLAKELSELCVQYCVANGIRRAQIDANMSNTIKGWMET
jgi:uncharacterized protein YutE (UPF0331/DUF86 family)